MGNCISCCRKKGKKKEKYISQDDSDDIPEKNERSQEVENTMDEIENTSTTDVKDKPEKRDVEDRPPLITEKPTTTKIEPKIEKKDEPEDQKSKGKKVKDKSESDDSTEDSSSSDDEQNKDGRYPKRKTVINNITNAKNVAIGHNAQFIDKRVYLNNGNNNNEKKKPKMKETKKTPKDKAENCDEFLKSKNETGEARHLILLSKATKSVGMIHMDNNEYGTGFRVGSRYVMTAYHVVRRIIDPKKTGNFCVERLAHESVWIVFKYNARNEVFFADYKSLQFHFQPEIIYANQELDTAVLALQGNESEFPKPIQNFAEMDESKSTYLLGHPDGDPMKYDPKIEVFERDEKLFESAKKWSLKHYHKDGYEGIEDARKILFHTSFQHGASGSPGVMLTSQDKVTVVLMLLKGFPSFYYNDFNESERKIFRESYNVNFLLEQGISMKSIWKTMKDNNDYAQLCEDIFPNDCFNA